MLHPILQRVEAIGGAVFTEGDYNLNIVAVRRGPEHAQANRFDDSLHLLHKESGRWVDRWYRCTTDPGAYWLERGGMNPLGCAAVVADRQYRSCWRLGLHRGSYMALVQRGCSGDIAVHRDDNRDRKVDYRTDNIDVGNHSINLHRASTRRGGSVAVNKWSAGCIVIADPGDFAEVIRICKKQPWPRYSFTLINEWTP